MSKHTLLDAEAILKRAQDHDHPMSVELALFIASKIAAALDYAHRKHDFEGKEMGLVHRDVSPQNVLISEEGDIKLCDFGIAKAASKASHTQAGALKGKLQYMSPEQAWGRNIDRRSDIFALATVLFEMLTARKLFSGDNELSILEQVREARVVPPSQYNDEVAPEIDKIVLKALQKDPANRYQTAGEMARDIDAILYSFKPTPTSADLAIYMHRMSTSEPVAHLHAPEPEPAPVPVAKPTPVPAAVPVAAAAATVPAHAPAAEAHVPEPWEQPRSEKKSPVPMIAIAAVVLIAILGGVYAMTRKKSDTPAPAQTASAATTSAASPLTAPTTTATTTAATTAAPTSTAPAIDNAAVDQEVARRMAAERARLEAAARAQQPAAGTPATQTAAPVRPAPAPTPVPVQPPPQTQTVAESRPAPAPVVEQPTPQPAPPTPQPEAPTRRVYREGELVPAGTEGLIAPRITRMGTVPYPQVARIQRVEGTVLTSVLVSESGQVLEVRIVRGINRAVGLNEAAEQTMRRSTFAPATIDGVRVRAWVTVPVRFAL